MVDEPAVVGRATILERCEASFPNHCAMDCKGFVGDALDMVFSVLLGMDGGAPRTPS
jgi:hypothetical protein